MSVTSNVGVTPFRFVNAIPATLTYARFSVPTYVVVEPVHESRFPKYQTRHVIHSRKEGRTPKYSMYRRTLPSSCSSSDKQETTMRGL